MFISAHIENGRREYLQSTVCSILRTFHTTVCIPFTYNHAETKINCKITKNINFEDKHTFTQWYQKRQLASCVFM